MGRGLAIGMALLVLGCHPRLAAPPEGPADPASVSRGKQVFSANCAPCHGESARGDGPLAADFDPPPTDLVAPGVHTSLKGVQLVITMPHYSGWLIDERVREGKGQMPAWKDKLSQQQVDDLVAYVRFLSAEEDAKE